MDLKMVSGCICDSLTIDGKEEIDLNDEEREEVFSYILSNIEIPESKFSDFLEWCLVTFGEFTLDGDYKDKDWEEIYTLKI